MEEKKEREGSLVIWTLITLATLGMIWQGILADKIIATTVIFLYYIGIAMYLKKRKE